jgi:hypothetical protein
LAWLGIAAFTLSSLVIAIRLLRLWRGTRQVPELAMGLSFATSGALGFPLVMGAAIADAAGDAETSHALGGLGLFLMSVGTLSLAVGNGRIYRPHNTRAIPAWLGCIATLLVAALSVYLVSDDARPGGRREIALWVVLLTGAVVFAWSAAEAFALHLSLRRRARLGLASLEVANRVLLWGIGSGASCGMTLYALAGRLISGPVTTPEQQVVSSLIGGIVAIAIWLAFFPPAAYRARFAAPNPTQAS